MVAIWTREVQSYFKTAVGYVFMGFFLLLSGLMFVFNNLFYASGDIAGMFNSISMPLAFIMPILTMRLFSEERKNKSEQLLLTSPQPLSSIVLGKFLAAATVWLITLAGTLLYVLIIGVYGKLYVGELVTNYLGFFLMGCAFISVGVLVSAMTENQVSAAVVTIGINFFIWVIDSVIYIVPIEFLSAILEWFSIYQRYDPFTRAQLGVSGVLYFASFCAVFLFLTVRVIDKRRWSEG